MAHLSLIGYQETVEIDPVLVTEAGNVVLDLQHDDRPPNLWAYRGTQSGVEWYGDSLKEVIQLWSLKVIASTLPIVSDTRLNIMPSETKTLDGKGIHLVDRYKRPIARFTDEGEAESWLQLLKATPHKRQEALPRYLCKPLSHTGMESPWWLPYEFTTYPFIMDRGFFYGPSKIKGERWHSVATGTTPGSLSAAFNCQAMYNCFSAAKLHRLCESQVEFGIGSKATHEGRPCIVRHTPEEHLLQSSSTVLISLDRTAKLDCTIADLTPMS